MSQVIIIDDEEVLRTSMARGVAKMPGVEVRTAASLDEALHHIDQRVPDLVVSDIDMPERSGIELLGELGRRGLSLPVIFVSAYLKAFRAQLPRHANIEAVEKPFPLMELRALISAKLARKDEGEQAPFSVPDYLQLACMGRHSVVIEVGFPDGSEGQIIVHAGDVWSARAGERSGREAFAQVAFGAISRVACRRLESEPGPREMAESAEALLIDAARILDETEASQRPPARVSLAPGEEGDPFGTLSSLPPSGVPKAGPASRRPPRAQSGPLPSGAFAARRLSYPARPAPTPPPPAATASVPSRAVAEVEDEDARFDEHWERGLTALLKKDFTAAWDAFSAAQALRPDDAKVRANLNRLTELGCNPANKDTA